MVAVYVENSSKSNDIEFDAWFSLRSKQIPVCHHKEVILAAFKGQGLSALEPLDRFDRALKKYGITLE
jgi:hypothetical protein